MIANEYKSALGIVFCGFRTSSPVVAMQSNPTKPKKQVAAPFKVPENPKGKKPPVPVEFCCSAGTSTGLILQLLISALKITATIT